MYTKKTFSPTDPNKIDALEHVLYEISMFVSLPIKETDALVSNCLTEAYLVHARVLCDFFQQTRYRDDITSADYGFEQRSLGISQDIETRFDKCLADLTYSRTCFTDDTKHWLSVHFRPPLLKRIKEFLTHLTSNCSLALKSKDLNDAEALLGKLENI